MPNWIRSIWSFLVDYWIHCLNLLSELAFGIYAVLVLEPNPVSFLFTEGRWLLVFGLVILLSSLAGIVRSIRITELQEKIHDLNSSLETSIALPSTILENQLAHLANDLLEFSNSERISIYVHDGQLLVMLARYALNPNFKKRGRKTLSLEGSGCVSGAWNNGEASVMDLPDPVRNYKGWQNRLKADWSINKGISRRFTMNSRSYVALGLDHVSRVERIAVIVFESTNPRAFDIDTLRRICTNGDGLQIREILSEMSASMPRLSYALQEGF